MRAKFINEWESGYYPPGAEHDPSAPWNQPDDDSNYELGMDGNELYITRRYNYSAEDEWDEDKGYIDPETFDLFAAEKLGINAEDKWEDDDYLEIDDIEDIVVGKQFGEKFLFKTSWGDFEASMDELVDMTNLF